MKNNYVIIEKNMQIYRDLRIKYDTIINHLSYLAFSLKINKILDRAILKYQK